jgi:hypothetical protein
MCGKPWMRFSLRDLSNLDGQIIGNPAHPGIGRELEGLDSRSSSIVYLSSLTRSAFSEKSVRAMHKVYEGMLAVAGQNFDLFWFSMLT